MKKSQKEKGKRQKAAYFALRVILGIFFITAGGYASVRAQETSSAAALNKKITEASTSESTFAASEELKALYFKDNKFSEFIDELNTLVAKKKTLSPLVNYYIGLSRYQQLKYLEEKQLWDEYFSQGNTYREQLTDSLQNTITATTPSDVIHLYGRLILWRFHRDQQDVFHEQALIDLMNAALEFAKSSQEASPLKEVADALISYGEKAKSRELYKIYVQRIALADLKNNELEAIAQDFFLKGNAELSQLMYDLYIERISSATPKEKLVPVLLAIAKRFYFDSDSAQKDLLYAEKVFQKIQESAGKEAFDEDLQYARAFNLEKAKEFIKAKDHYLSLLTRYPDTVHKDEALYKVGMIDTYVARAIASGRQDFEKLIQGEKSSPQAIAALYQLGLLSQWENDTPKAKGYYQRLLEETKDDFQETAALASLRLREIEEAKPIEYNLKTFLDVTFTQGYEMFDMSRAQISSSAYRLKKDELVTIEASSALPESGCMQVALQYLWSGSLGKAVPGLEEPSFDTAYLSAGTKEINVVVMSATGILDRSFDLLDVK